MRAKGALVAAALIAMTALGQLLTNLAGQQMSVPPVPDPKIIEVNVSPDVTR